MLRTVLFLLLSPLAASAQFPPNFQPPQHISSDEALDRVLNKNVLTHDGKPFHAVLDLHEEKGDPAYMGRVELIWAGERRYKLILTSRDFDQTLIVNGDQIEERDRGEFYPGWLNNFVTALLNPMPRLQDLRGQNRSVAIGPQMSYSCVKREDRPNGITNDLTWAEVCFSGDAPTLQFDMDFTYNMEFHDFGRFGKKEIARRYISGEADHARIDGTLTTLEELKSPDPALFTIAHPTPSADRILTTLVSTRQEEAMVESRPQDVHWPNPHEGPLSGYMIVQAITDRTGQVRETSKHNSDNAEMESYGRLVALQYKFHPLMVDGVAQQMEIPLVLHFEAATLTPYHTVNDAETRQLVRGCKLPTEIRAPAASGQTIHVQLVVVEDGGISEIGDPSHTIPPLALY
ncbi:MAG TPA: hypothetical protein VGM11_10830, partial [Acidobacteriaceae bacterium]